MSRPMMVKQDEELTTALDLMQVIASQKDERIFDLEREVQSLHMHPRTWEKIQANPFDGIETTWNHFRGMLVVKDSAIAFGKVAIRWMKPA